LIEISSMQNMYLMMHQFVFCFDLGWLARFSLICPQNI